MTLFASIVVLFFVGLFVCGLFVHMYLYSHGAFSNRKVTGMTRSRLGSASFSQTATIPIPESATELYYGGIGVRHDGMYRYSVRLTLYTLGILLTLIILGVLVLGATRF